MRDNYTRTFYRIIFLLLGGVFILGQFGRFELGSGRAIYFQDLMLSVFVGIFVIDRWSTLRKRYADTALWKSFSLINIWILGTSFLHYSQSAPQLFTSVLYLLRFDVIVGFAMALTDAVKRGVLSRSELTSWLIGVPSAIAIFGFIQYFLYPDTRNLQLLGWDDHYYRLISTIFDPGYTGIILVLGIIVVLFKILNQEFRIKNQGILLTACFVLLASALLLTYSRASYLAFLVGTLFLSWRQRKYALLLLLPIFGICMVGLPRPGGEGVRLERTASVLARVESVDSALSGFHPTEIAFGRGWYWQKERAQTSFLRGQEVPNHSVAAENSLIFIVSSLGLVGLGIFWLFGSAVLRSVDHSSEWLSVFITVLIHSLFTNTLFYPMVLMYLAVLTAKNARGSL